MPGMVVVMVVTAVVIVVMMAQKTALIGNVPSSSKSWYKSADPK